VTGFTDPRNSLDTYLNEGYQHIAGWLHQSAVDATLGIGDIQREAGVAGPICEIGVWEGRYLTLLSFLPPGEQRIVGVDPFIHVPDRAAQLARLHQNIDQYACRPPLVTILERGSESLSAAELIFLGGGRYQFASVDGDHTMAGCLRDLWLVEQLLAPGGVIAVDDICNMTCPGVVEAAVRYGTSPGATLAPFLIAGNKLFMTQRAECTRYRSKLLARARAGALGTVSAPVADFDARMNALDVPVRFLDEPILVAA
jgi:hypothetical protein